MFVTVRILKGYPKPLTYASHEKISVGDIVSVPLRNRSVFSVVTAINVARPPGDFAIREVEGRVAQPKDIHYQSYIQRLSLFYCIDPQFFYERLYAFLGNDGTQELPAVNPVVSSHEVSLTGEQERVLTDISATLNVAEFSPHLLHGVTGSGKTEVYKALIEKVIQKGNSVLFLCPEVSLARILAKRLAEYEQISIHVFDSQTTKKEKDALWTALMNAQPIVIVGVHLPILLPIPNLGLIIVDEEHAQGFTEKKSPYINSKQCALLRAQHVKIPILLGSATPSVSLVHYAEHSPWKVHTLSQRYAGTFPKVELVSLREPHKRKHFWLTPSLISEITKTLQEKRQAIVYINRRGFSVSMQCKQCGELFECPDCSVSLTVHKSEDDIHLECHYCNRTMAVPKVCPGCQKETEKVALKGVGTQQVVSLLEKIFPNARVARGDADASRKKKSWRETLSQFEAGDIDIFVGTQLITKGYHFPNVTLVGVLWGDNGLHYPSYTAHEEALQQLVQVAGRAGRFHKESKILVQHFADSPVFSYINEERYLEFCQRELSERKITEYPPFSRLATIELRHSDEKVVQKEAVLLAQTLELLAQDEVLLLGPAKPVVHKVQKVHVRHILLKGKHLRNLHALMLRARKQQLHSSLSFLLV